MTRKTAGQSIIEMIVSIAIVLFAIIGILVLANKALGLNEFISNQYTATYLAAEGIEVAKNIFDKEYLDAPPKSLYGLPADGIAHEIDYDEIVYDSTNEVSSCVWPSTGNIDDLFANQTCSQALRPLMFDPATGLYSYDSGNQTKFRRVIIFTDNYPGELKPPGPPVVDFKVISAVEWQSRSGKFIVNLEDHFTPWHIKL